MTLQPESTVEGVVDFASVDVELRAPWMTRGYTRHPRGPTTDAAGRFRIDGLAAGRYALVTSHPSRPDTEPVEVGDGERRSDVRLESSAGCTFRGRLIGAASGFVQLNHNGAPCRCHTLWPVDSDGVFVARGLAAGSYDVHHVVATPSGPVMTRLDPAAKVEGEGSSATWDVTATRPGRLALSIEAPSVPRLRLAVRAADASGSTCEREVRVDEDGRCDLDVAPGEVSVTVFDALTETPLHIESGVAVAPGATVRRRVAFDVATVDLRIVPAAPEVAAATVELRLTPAGGGELGTGGRFVSAPDVVWPDEPLRWYLPAGSVEFRARLSTDVLVDAERRTPELLVPRGTVSCPSVVGETRVVELRVAAPPALTGR